MMHISMLEWAQKVDLGKELFYRPKAVKMYDKLFPDIQHLQGGTLLNCSFENIEGCDASFADEFVIKLQNHISNFNNVVLILTHCNESILENLKGALLIRNEMDKVKTNILYYDMGYHFLLKQEANLQETFDYVQKHDEVSARDIAEVFGIEINSASNRLKKLYDANKLFRKQVKDEKGRLHIYYINSL